MLVSCPPHKHRVHQHRAHTAPCCPSRREKLRQILSHPSTGCQILTLAVRLKETLRSGPFVMRGVRSYSVLLRTYNAAAALSIAHAAVYTHSRYSSTYTSLAPTPHRSTVAEQQTDRHGTAYVASTRREYGAHTREVETPALRPLVILSTPQYIFSSNCSAIAARHKIVLKFNAISISRNRSEYAAQ